MSFNPVGKILGRKLINDMISKDNITRCKNCKTQFFIPEVSKDQPDSDYSNPVTHGFCPNCNRPYYKKVKK